MILTYTIGYDKGEGMDYISCNVCGTRSYHTDDIMDKCCPYCDKTHKQIAEEIDF